MTTDGFGKFLRVRPFEPFMMHLADGRAIRVPHPDAASFSSSGRTVLLLNDDGKLEMIDLLLVISLRPLSPTELKSRR